MDATNGAERIGEDATDKDIDRPLVSSSSLSLSSPSLSQVQPSLSVVPGQHHHTREQQRPSTAPPPDNMPKLSDAVKALINAGHARPGYTRAGAQVKPALERLANDAHQKKVGLPAWVTVSVWRPSPWYHE